MERGLERYNELKSVLDYLVIEKGLRVHKAIQYDRAVDYFRGI